MGALLSEQPSYQSVECGKGKVFPRSGQEGPEWRGEVYSTLSLT